MGGGRRRKGWVTEKDSKKQTEKKMYSEHRDNKNDKTRKDRINNELKREKQEAK